MCAVIVSGELEDTVAEVMSITQSGTALVSGIVTIRNCFQITTLCKYTVGTLAIASPAQQGCYFSGNVFKLSCIKKLSSFLDRVCACFT